MPQQPTQGGTVRLAVHGERPVGDRDDAVRLHVFGDRGRQVPSDRLLVECVAPEEDGDLGGASNGTGRGEAVGDIGVGAKSVLQFLQVDAVAVHLDLVVRPSPEEQLALRRPGPVVTGPVEPRTAAEGVRHELLAREPLVAHVPDGKARARDADLADDPQGLLAQPVVHDVHLLVGAGSTDRHGPLASAWIDAVQGRVDRRLGGPVSVVERRVPRETGGQLRADRLTR